MGALMIGLNPIMLATGALMTGMNPVMLAIGILMTGISYIIPLDVHLKHSTANQSMFQNNRK
ncbi:hypothetical protein GGGNBK_14425 [Sporosarcina sp. ANT_H38]